MAFRCPKLSAQWDKPIFRPSKEYSSFTRPRFWFFYCWKFQGGEWKNIGIRILGLQISLAWIYMTEEESEEFDQLRRDEQALDCDESSMWQGTREDMDWDDAEDGIF
jgi:hypothetical protein